LALLQRVTSVNAAIVKLTQLAIVNW